MPSLIVNINENFLKPPRLDRYVSENLKILSRSQIKTKNLKAKINGKDAKYSKLVSSGDRLDLIWDDFSEINFLPEDIPLDIVYEDENCVVVNKAQGMVVHPGAGNSRGTLANALYFRKLYKNKREPCGVLPISARPGIVHRLDKDTSGIIIAAYNDETLSFLSRQFKSRTTRKIYAAIIYGVPKENEGTIQTNIARDPKNRKKFAVAANGKAAVSFYKVIKSWNKYSLVLLRPKTGRTHQLRVHMRCIGHPVLGDPVYAENIYDSLFPKASLMLHSKSLAITLPGENDKRIFKSNLPERFTDIINKLNRINING